MNFFENQARARRSTRWLVVLYLLAVVAVIGAVCLGIGAAYAMGVLYGSFSPAGDVSVDYGRLGVSFWRVMQKGVPSSVYGWSAAATAVVILGATAYKVLRLSGGGEAVAEMVGARRIEPGSADLLERRLVNVVEEMAIASGIAVPPVYVMDDERGINAFAAGYSPNEAVVAVTRGTLEKLNRDELQGVVGHEFSHILNGDMRMNVRLIGILFGIVVIGQFGEFLVRSTARTMRATSREGRGATILVVFVGLALTVIGYLGLVFARLIKAAISRQREFLADASSVQFTRNPDGIAGALDTISASTSGTHVAQLHAEEMSHMFFAQAVANWFGALFDTHPPLAERIRRVHPRFQRREYRGVRAQAQRAAAPREVAVIDATGTVVKTLGGADWGRAAGAEALAVLGATIGTATPEHVDHAAKLLASLPQALRDLVATPAGAEPVMFALTLEPDEPVRRRELEALRARRGSDAMSAVEQAYAITQRLDRAYALPLMELALPSLKRRGQKARDAFIEDFGALIEADRRVTLTEFVVFTFLKMHLREGAGKPLPATYKSVAEIAADAHAVLSLVAHAARGDAVISFKAGVPVLGIELEAPLPVADLSARRVSEALERLRVLAPLQKPRILKACMQAANADGAFALPEVELLRVVAATLDCPVPPLLTTIDPTALPH